MHKENIWRSEIKDIIIFYLKFVNISKSFVCSTISYGENVLNIVLESKSAVEIKSIFQYIFKGFKIVLLLMKTVTAIM